MKRKSKDYLSLFLVAGKVCVYVIDNELIYLNDSTDAFSCPFKAYNLLLELFESGAEQVFPEELRRFFENGSKIGLDYCVLGAEDYHKFEYCIDFDLKVINKKKEVQLHNFEIRLPHGQKKCLQNKLIKLSVSDAFFILANCAVNGCRMYLETYESLDIYNLLNQITNLDSFKELMNDIPENAKLSYQFALAYLLYIKNELEKETIKPEIILRLSGAYVLALLAKIEPVKNFLLQMLDQLKEIQILTHNQKILYYTLSLIIQEKELKSQINSFYEFNVAIAHQLKNELLKEII